MTGWAALAPAAGLFLAGAGLTYGRHRTAAWAPAAFAGLAMLTGLLWGWAVRRLPGGAAEAVRLSAAWDALMACAYYLLPAVLVGAGVGWRTWAGAGLVLAGCLVLKGGR